MRTAVRLAALAVPALVVGLVLAWLPAEVSDADSRAAVKVANRATDRAALPASDDVHFATRSKRVALTFDDGPDPVWTPKILELLKENGVKATFCLVGDRVREHPELVRRIAAEGHTLCNHTKGHELDLRDESAEQIRTNLTETNDLIADAAGRKPKYFRAPGGFWSPEVVGIARELGMASIGWTVDPQDWREPGTAAIATTLREQCRNGAIVLLHDGGGDRGQTYEAVRDLLPELEDGFTLTAL
jgi:peptidoglycan/xylan/chitin deacetylase (PgdA/CDA1 family)